MTAIAATLQGFFTERLAQRGVSPHTVAAYRDSLRLLVCFVHDTTGKPPSQLDFEDLDADTVADFLRYLETVRHSSVTTRNARLAAVHSLFRYAALRHPEQAATIGRVLAIPAKRHDQAQVCFLTALEVEALLAAPDQAKRTGRRDHALLLTAVQTGLRASELLDMRVADIHLDTGPHVDCLGKGRKQRSTPLGPEAVAVLDRWLRERAGSPSDTAFPGPRGQRLSRNALGQLVTKHAVTAATTCPSLAAKNVTPHVFRHTCAMRLLENGVDVTVIAMWLGHESLRSTQTYINAHMPSRNRPSTASAHPERHRGATRPPTTSSPSSTTVIMRSRAAWVSPSTGRHRPSRRRPAHNRGLCIRREAQPEAPGRGGRGLRRVTGASQPRRRHGLQGRRRAPARGAAGEEQVGHRLRRGGRSRSGRSPLRRGGSARPQPHAHLGRTRRRQQPPDRAHWCRGDLTRGRGPDRRRSRPRDRVPVGGRLVLLLRGGRGRRGLGARQGARCAARKRPAGRGRHPPTRHGLRPRKTQAQQGRRGSQIPREQGALPRLPERARPGWPIATGVIEGACRYLVADRMDITGARWSVQGAEAVLKLRAVRANGDFDDYWRFHLDHERQRVHESRYQHRVVPLAA